MRRTAVAVVLVFVVAMALISISCPEPVATGENIDSATAMQAPPDTAVWDGPENDDRPEFHHPKIDPDLCGLVEFPAGDVTETFSSGSFRNSLDFAGRAHIQVLAAQDDLDAAISTLISTGGEVTGVGTAGFGECAVHPDVRIVQGWAPIRNLEKLASEDAVLYVRNPVKALMLYEKSVDSALSALDPDAWHSAGFCGEGVRIGVVDSGFADMSDAECVENNVAEFRNFADIDPDDSLNENKAGGSESLRTIHEIAPKAQLYVAKVDTYVDVQKAIDWLVNEVGVHVVRTSMVDCPFRDETSFSDIPDETGRPFAEEIYWAAPDASSIWDRRQYGPFNDRGDGFHLFAPGSNVELFQSSNDGGCIFANSMKQVFLMWEHAADAAADLDLYLLNWDGFAWSPLAVSKKTHPLKIGRFPVESLSTESTDAVGFYGYAVSGRDIPENLSFEIVSPDADAVEKSADSGTERLTSSQEAGIAALIMSADSSLFADEIRTEVEAGLEGLDTFFQSMIKDGYTIAVRNSKAEEDPDCPIHFEHDFTGTYNAKNDWQDLVTSPPWVVPSDLSARRLKVVTSETENGVEIRILVNGGVIETWIAGKNDPDEHEKNVDVTISKGDIVTYEFKNGTSESGSITSPVDVYFCNTPNQETGSLKVTISPQEAIDQGAMWRVDGGEWQISGYTLDGVSIGTRTVSYKTVYGWDSPDEEQVLVNEGTTTETSGTYTLQTGSLQVNIAPDGAVGAGAQWQVDGGAWQDDGATVNVLAVGSHELACGSIEEWVAPKTQSIGIKDDQTTVVTVEYIPETGNDLLILDESGNAGIGDYYPDEKVVLSEGNFLQTASNPRHMGAITDDATTAISGPMTLFVSGKYAYVASCDDDGVEILDISDPSNPTHMGVIYDDATTELDCANGIYVSGKYAYVTAGHDDGVEILDISDPSNPTHVGAISDDETTVLDGVRRIQVVGNYAYVTAYAEDGVEILDISDPSNPTHVGSITNDDTRELYCPIGIHVSGKYAYVAANCDDGVEILDISDPSNPIHVGAITDDETTELDGAVSIHVSGMFAYVASVGDDGVEILDISDPSNPTHAGAITDDETTALDGAIWIRVFGKYAYVASFYEDGIEVLDISDPSNPTHAGVIVDDGIKELDGASCIQIAGKYAYVASEDDDGFEILDISGIDAPAATIGTIAADSLDVSGNAQISNNLSVGGGLNLGSGGIKSDGPMSAEGSFSVGGELNAQGRMSINDMLKMTPRDSPPDSPQDGYVYYDRTDQDALCVYLEGSWIKIAGSGDCQ